VRRRLPAKNFLICSPVSRMCSCMRERAEEKCRYLEGDRRSPGWRSARPRPLRDPDDHPFGGRLRRACLCLGNGSFGPAVEGIDCVRERPRFAVARVRRENGTNALPRPSDLSRLEESYGIRDLRIELSLPLGYGLLGPIDSDPCLGVAAVEEQDPGPDVNGLSVLPARVEGLAEAQQIEGLRGGGFIVILTNGKLVDLDIRLASIQWFRQEARAPEAISS